LNASIEGGLIISRMEIILEKINEKFEKKINWTYIFADTSLGEEFKEL
jgi:hypothetical protein